MEPRLYEVTTESLETWAAEYQDQTKWGECLERMPQAQLDEWNEVAAGRASLKTPDGRVWWAPVTGGFDHPRMEGEVAQALLDYVIDHKCTHGHIGPSFPLLLWDSRTLDPSEVFCVDCGKFVNLSDDARVYDELGNRNPDEDY